MLSHVSFKELRFKEILLKKDSPTFLYWYLVTFAVGAFVALWALMLWTTISPFGHGTDALEKVQTDNANSIFSGLACLGLGICLTLYFFDFYSAPHLLQSVDKSKISKFEQELDEGYHEAQKKAMDGDKTLPTAAGHTLKRNSFRADVSKLKGVTVDTFFEEENYRQYVEDAVALKPRHMVMGHTEVSPWGTFIARVLFGFAILLMGFYGFIRSNKYPTRPLLMTILLYFVLHAVFRKILRPRKHLAPEPYTEIDIATEIMRKYGKDPTAPSYLQARDHLEHLLADRMILEADKRVYYNALALSTFTIVVILIILYSIWTYGSPGYGWDNETKDMLSTAGIEDEDTQWAIWAGPGILILAYSLFGTMFYLRAYVHEHYIHTDERLNKLQDLLNNHHTKEDGAHHTKVEFENGQLKEIERIMKITMTCIICIGLGFWVAAEAAAAQPAVAYTVKQFLLGFMLIFACFLAFTLKRFTDAIKKSLKENFFLKQMLGLLKSDWIKGFGLLIFPYWLPIYALITAINKFVRTCRGIEDKRDYSGIPLLQTQCLTKQGSRFFKRLSTWNWTSIIGKAYVMGIVMFVLNVFAEKCIYLMLIYVGEGFDAIPTSPGAKCVVVIILWFLVGVVAFMLPPVPGPPVYLFGGVVVVRAFDQIGPAGFWTGCAIVIVFSLFLKLSACAIQQKLIGERLGQEAWVKAACGVQTPFIRAVELILKRKGLSMGKVGILCGGPDWPTSVLTGLLKCDLKEMMLGTLPMILLIVPTVLTGAFFLKTDPVYSTIGSFLFIMSLLVCAGNGMYATYAVQNELEAHPNYLRIKLLKNRELDWIDYKNSQFSNIHYEVNSWDRISTPVKILMVIGLLIMNFAMFLFSFYADACFGSYDLQTPSKHFKDGTITLVEPLGWVALGTFACACIIFYAYKKVLVQKAEVRRGMVRNKLESPETKDTWIKECNEDIEKMEQLMKERQPEDYERYSREKVQYQEIADSPEPLSDIETSMPNPMPPNNNTKTVSTGSVAGSGRSGSYYSRASNNAP